MKRKAFRRLRLTKVVREIVSAWQRAGGQRGRAQLRRLLEEGAERRAARDLTIAEEWFPVGRDAWRKRRK